MKHLLQVDMFQILNSVLHQYKCAMNEGFVKMILLVAYHQSESR